MVVLGWALTACSAVQTRVGPGDVALLELDCQPSDAEIWIDGQYVGKITQWRGGIVPLTPGDHRVKIAAEGYYPYRRDLTAKSGQSYRLALDLVPDLESEDDELEREEAR